MKKFDLSQVIKEIRSASVRLENCTKNVYPYIELYPRFRRKAESPRMMSKKQLLMLKVREKFQSLTNPYQHKDSLKREDVERLLPRIRDKDLDANRGGIVMRKRLACKSVTPNKKKNLLFYRLPLEVFDLK